MKTAQALAEAAAIATEVVDRLGQDTRDTVARIRIDPAFARAWSDASLENGALLRSFASPWNEEACAIANAFMELWAARARDASWKPGREAS